MPKNNEQVNEKAMELARMKEAISGERKLSEKEYEKIQEYMYSKKEENKESQQKNEYHLKASQIINLEEFKLDRKATKQEITFVLDHFVHKKSLDQCKAYLKRTFKINDQDAVKMIRKLKNMYQHLEKKVK